MKTIKELKIGNAIHAGYSVETTDENGVISSNLPDDLNTVKEMALDTVNWQIGNSVRQSVGGADVNLSASNAKAIALLAKLIVPSSTKLDKLTDLERDSWNKITALADNGYADSKLLNASLTSVTAGVTHGTDKAIRITKAKSQDEVIAILNEA